MIFERFFPDRTEESAYAVDYGEEHARGIRAVIFDIDNTLVPHDAPATEECVRLFSRIREAGLATCLISNNGEERVKPFSEKVGSLYLCKAGKPGKKAYRNAMALLGTSLSDTLFIGDQLLTDIFGANRAKMQNILVKPVDLSTDLPRIRFKRKIEKIILKRYQKAVQAKNT